MSTDGQGSKWQINNRLSRGARTLQSYDRQTDGPATAYSEREREFTFAKN